AAVHNTIRATAIPVQWHSGLPFYASPQYLQTVGNEYGWLGGFDGSETLRCILPYTVIRKPGFRFVRFRVETIAVGGELDLAEEESFLSSVVEHLRSIGAHLIVPASNNAIFRTYPRGAIAAPYGTIINNLAQPEETLWKDISKAYRKDIRRAIRN